MSAASKVCFFYQGVRFSFSERTKLKLFIEGLFRKEGKKLEQLNYIFCTDAALLSINRQYLQHDYYTDIISFDLSEGPATTGDIFISIDRVKDNAKQLDLAFRDELCRVIFHGALHLCGYGDKKPAEIKVMREKENYYLENWRKKRK